jgi:hypothetical protein
MAVTSTSATARWASYDAWNDVIHDWFFTGRFAQQPVYLDLETDVLRELADRVGPTDVDPTAALLAALTANADPAGALVEAVTRTLNLDGDLTQLFYEHYRRTIQWEYGKGDSLPPFLALLAFFSLVAERMAHDGGFSSSNYYGRLCEILALDGREGPTKQQVVRGYMDYASPLWRALNRWIEAGDGVRGKPTAYAFDFRVHVGLPISQALVREGDRRALLHLFLTYRLQPGQVISRSDMTRLIEDWLPTAPVSNSLRQLVASVEALGRVADVACVELQAWDGSLPVDEGHQQAPPAASLILVARIHKHPRPRLVIEPIVQSPRAIPGGAYRVETTTPHAAEAFAGLNGVVEIEDAQVDGFQTIRDFDLISIPDLLYANVRLQHGGLKVCRDPRRLVVLELEEASWGFIEVARARLGQGLLLLCVDDLLDDVERILAECARPGFAVYRSGELAGVPVGWGCVASVELFRLPETKNMDLASLVPVAWTEVSLGGGLRLPGRSTWLRGSPPEARVAALADINEVDVKLIDESEPTASPVLLGTVSESGVVALPDRLDDGDYRVVVEPQGEDRVLASAALRIRSDITPRPLLGDERDFFVHPLGGSPWAMLSSEPMAELPSSGALIGALVVGEDSTRDRHGGMPPTSLGGHVDRRADIYADETPAEEPALVARAGDPPACIRTGAHYIVLPDAGPGSTPWNAKIEGYCKNCGLEKYFPARYQRRFRGARAQPRQQPGRRLRGPVVPVAAPKPLRVKPVVDGAAHPLAELVQALEYARRGPWSSFEGLATQFDDAPWFAQEVARLMSALGHLELRLDPSSQRAEAWSLAPTTIATTTVDGRAVLCGARSEPLLNALRDRVSALGGGLRLEGGENDLPVAMIEGLDADALDEVAAKLSTEEMPVKVSMLPARRNAFALSPLSSVAALASRFAPPLDRLLERWDLREGGWSRASDVDSPGVYRTISFPRRYGVHLDGMEPRQLMRGDARLVKWLAGIDAGISLLAYDPESRELECLLGAELPGLYERAAVLCSGLPPVQMGATVVYRDVTADVASAIWEAVRT